MCCWPTRPCASVRAIQPVVPEHARIISAAEVTDSVAIHPGYGSSRKCGLRRARREERLHLRGPPRGDHSHDGRQGVGIKVMKAAGVPACPFGRPLGTDIDENFRIAKEIGYPVIIKASGGAAAAACAWCTRTPRSSTPSA